MNNRGLSLIFVMKKPNSIAKNIIESIWPFISDSKILDGIICINVSPKLVETADMSSTGILNPRSAPTPGLISVTRKKPVIIAANVENI